MVVIGALILAFLIFHVGAVYGSHRNPFGRHDAEYGFRSSFFPRGFELPHEFIQNDHGAVGSITLMMPPTFTMQTRDGASQTILIGTSTVIRGRTPLSAGDGVIILGEPDSLGRIDATLIRVLVATSTMP